MSRTGDNALTPDCILDSIVSLIPFSKENAVGQCLGNITFNSYQRLTSEELGPAPPSADCENLLSQNSQSNMGTLIILKF